MSRRRALAAALAGLALFAAAGEARAGGLHRRGAGLAARSSVVVDGQLRPLFVFVYGQSNAAASAGNTLPVNTTNGAPVAPPFRNHELRTSTWVAAYAETGAANTELVCYGTMNQLANMTRDAEGDLTVAGGCQSGAVPSQRYTQLEDGTGAWTTQWNEARALVAGFQSQEPLASGPPLILFMWLQGESDQSFSNDRALYVSQLLDLWQDACDEMMAPSIGATSCPPVYLVPYGGVTRLGTMPGTLVGEQSEIVMAHYEACRDYPARFVCAHPGYQSPMPASNEHYTGEGHAVNGEQVARVFYTREVLRDAWSMLRPVAGALSCTNNVVTVPLTGGVGTQLAIDTTNAARRPHLGFEYVDGQADPPSILTATVSTALQAARLVLSRNCAPSSARVRYAYSAPAGCDSGRAGCGVGGNVRRAGACTPNVRGTEQLCDWLMPFDEPISTISGTAEASPVFSDFGVGVRLSGTAAAVTSRSSTVTNGAANMTASIWRRTPASASANVILEKWQGTNGRVWSIRANTSNRVEFYLSANGAALAYTCTSANNVYAPNTWTHFAFVKNGTSFVPYVNGAAITCASTTGAVPATLYDSTWASFAIGNGSTGGGTDGSLHAHAAVWHMALTAPRVAALYSAAPIARPADPRLQSASHYWPLQGDWGDYGLAAPRPMYPGLGVTRVEPATFWGTSDTIATFSAANLLNGAGSFVARLDFVANTPSQAGTFLDRDAADSTQRHLHLGWTTGRQLVARLATTLTEGGGEWPADAARDECVTDALTSGQRYRAAVLYDGPQATNAARLRVVTAPVTETTNGDGSVFAEVGAETQRTCTFLGTIPGALTSPTTAAWTVGRRASGTASTGLRSVQLDGNGITLWAGVVPSAAQVSEVLRAPDPTQTSLGAPVANWRFRGGDVVETVAQGGGALTGGALGTAYVTPTQLRWPTAPDAGVLDSSVADVLDASSPDVLDASSPDVLDASSPDVADAASTDTGVPPDSGMRGYFTLDLIAQLDPELGNVLGRETTAPGTSNPFTVLGGASNTFVETGINVGFAPEMGCGGGCGNPTINAATVGGAITLTSGTTLNAAAEFLTRSLALGQSDLTGNPFSTTTGWVSVSCAIRSAPNPAITGQRSAVQTFATVFDVNPGGAGQYEPMEMPYGFGFGFFSNSAPATGWYACNSGNTGTGGCINTGVQPTPVDGTGGGWLVPLARDATQEVCALTVVRAGTMRGSHALFSRATSGSPWVINYQNVNFNLFSAGPYHGEWACSPASSGIACTHTLTIGIQGALGYNPP